MQRRTKDLILVYVGFAIFAVLIFPVSLGIKTWHDSMNTKPQVQEKQEVSIIYDTPVQNPAANVKQVDMLPDYPSGDEFAAATSFLNSYGYSATIESLLDEMNYSKTNFVECYVGDPATDTGYCYTPALVICMNNYLVHAGGQVRTQNMSNLSFEDMSEYINTNHPMIVWYTSDGEQPRYTSDTYNDVFQMYENERVIVVYGIQNGIVAAIDPVEGQIEISTTEFEPIWEACGQQAIGVYYVND